MADLELKRKDLSYGYELQQPDDLTVGLNEIAQNVSVIGIGEFPRGLLLMSNADGYFTPATKEGISSANEICVLADSFSLDENEYTRAPAFFTGGFRGEKIILAWEDESTKHQEEISSIQSVLRKNKIFLF